VAIDIMTVAIVDSSLLEVPQDDSKKRPPRMSTQDGCQQGYGNPGSNDDSLWIHPGQPREVRAD
jgi:hypothetical protein